MLCLHNIFFVSSALSSKPSRIEFKSNSLSFECVASSGKEGIDDESKERKTVQGQGEDGDHQQSSTIPSLPPSLYMHLLNLSSLFRFTFKREMSLCHP